MKIDMNNKINIDHRTKFYAVIGDPIGHSLSPVFQNHFIKQRNINAVYIPLKISADTLYCSLEILKNNFAGFNVTIPHKESMMQYLDEIEHSAVKYGAVNTVKVVEGRLIGYNTDGAGFMRSIENLDIDLKKKRVLLIGAGGAARVIAHEIIKSEGILTIANRDTDRGTYLREELQEFHDVSINTASLKCMDAYSVHTPFDIIINSTPVGMYPDTDKSPITSNILQKAELVYDVIYNPLETELLKLGKRFGAKTANGLPMLIYQGLKSFEIWTGERATHEEEKEIYRRLKNRLCRKQGDL